MRRNWRGRGIYQYKEIRPVSFSFIEDIFPKTEKNTECKQFHCSFRFYLWLNSPRSPPVPWYTNHNALWIMGFCSWQNFLGLHNSFDTIQSPYDNCTLALYTRGHISSSLSSIHQTLFSPHLDLSDQSRDDVIFSAALSSCRTSLNWSQSCQILTWSWLFYHLNYNLDLFYSTTTTTPTSTTTIITTTSTTIRHINPPL